MTQNKLQNQHLSLGCGLIRIGRVWGIPQRPVPSENEVQIFLESAFDLGIRFFDTAPSYGLSEERLGQFVKRLTKGQRKEICISTKFGEHWNKAKNEPYVDHSYDALLSSLEDSYQRLGNIDLLQLHKATEILLEDSSMDRAFESAKAMGVTELGVSVSDINSGIKACSDDRFSYIQLPYNKEKTDLLPVIEKANIESKKVLFNRPFAMGSLVTKNINPFNFIFKTQASGFVLTGTASTLHLQENINSFKEAKYA